MVNLFSEEFVSIVELEFENYYLKNLIIIFIGIYFFVMLSYFKFNPYNLIK